MASLVEDEDDRDLAGESPPQIISQPKRELTSRQCARLTRWKLG